MVFHSDHLEEKLKKKLKKIITSDIEFQTFREHYNAEMEQLLVNKVAEKRKSNFYYNYVENKADINRELTNLTPSLNPSNPNYSVMPHDHIHPHHLLKDPQETHENKLKLLAYYDVIIDQHMRHVRPGQFHDNQFKFTKKNYIPNIFAEDDTYSNLFIEHKFSLDSEYHVKMNDHIDKTLEENSPNVEEVDDPVI